jgi:CRP-like cAMP-binding protein
MPHGRTTSLTVRLTAQERQTLQAWQRTTTLPAGQVRRGRIMLLLAEGRTITQMAHTVGISRRFVSTWVARLQAQGLAGLEALPRPGPWHTRRRAPR